jgi:hypothetical protein
MKFNGNLILVLAHYRKTVGSLFGALKWHAFGQISASTYGEHHPDAVFRVIDEKNGENAMSLDLRELFSQPNKLKFH